MGDPFEEKRLIEACLALLDEGLVVGIQDLGGAGLACATAETAARGGVGMDVDVAAVPRREPGMEPWEVMTSESQERMLAIVTPDVVAGGGGGLPALGGAGHGRSVGSPPPTEGPTAWRAVCGSATGSTARCWPTSRPPRWPTRPPSTTARWPLRPTWRPGGPTTRPHEPPPADGGADLLALLCDPSWVWRQYDHQLFLNTVVGPGGDAALLRLAGPGLPAERPGDGRHHRRQPPVVRARPPGRDGAGAGRVGLANLACVGARAVAVVNCLNFGNPEHPEVMWQLSEAVDGLAEACLAFGLPVIGGNVSLYNESAGRDIDPTGRPGRAGPGRSAPPPAARGPAGPTARRWWCWGPARRPTARGTRWPGAGGRSSAGAGGGGTLPALDTRRPPPAGRPGGRGGGRGAGRRGGPFHRGARRVGRRPRGGPGRDGGPLGDGAGRRVGGRGPRASSSASSPRGWWRPPTVPVTLVDRAAAAGVEVSVLGRAGGGRLVVPGLIDLGVDEMQEAQTGALPRALGQARAQ